MRRITLVGIATCLVVITIVGLTSLSTYDIGGNWSGTPEGYEEPAPDPPMLFPSKSSIDTVMNAGNVSNTTAILALIESENNVEEAIKYLQKNQ